MNTGIPIIKMANSRRQNQDSRVLEDAKSKVSDSAAKTIQDGDVRAVILDLIGTDVDVRTSIVDSVSKVIVSKLLANESFIAKLADGLMKDGVLDAIKQNVYGACALDNEKFFRPLSSHSSVDSMTWITTTERCERISIQWNSTAGVIASLCMASLRERKTPETPYCTFSTANSTCQLRPTASTAVIA